MTKFKKYLEIIQEMKTLSNFDNNILLLIEFAINNKIDINSIKDKNKAKKTIFINLYHNANADKVLKEIKNNMDKEKENQAYKILNDKKFKNINDEELLNFTDKNFYKINIDSKIEKNNILYLINETNNINDFKETLINKIVNNDIEFFKDHQKIYHIDYYTMLAEIIIENYETFFYNNIKKLLNQTEKFETNSDFNKTIKNKFIENKDFNKIIIDSYMEKSKSMIK